MDLVLRATVVFFFIVPDGDRCPNCDAVTLHVKSRGWNLVMPWFRTSWCYECGWHGLLRRGPLTPTSVAGEPTKQGSKKA